MAAVVTEASVQMPTDKTVQSIEASAESELLTVKALAGNTGNVRVGSLAQLEAEEGTVLAAGEEVTVDPSTEPSYRCEYSEDGIAWLTVGS